MRHWRKALLGLALTVLFLWLALRDVPFGDVWGHIREGDLGLLAVAVAIATGAFVLRAMRWKVLLTPIKGDTRLGTRFAAVAVHFMANNLLPARAGEFARAYAFSRLEPVSAGAAFGSLVVERMLDALVLLGFLLVPVLTPGFDLEQLTEGFGATLLTLGGLTVVVILAAVVALVAWPRAFARMGHAAARALPDAWERRTVDAMDAFLDAFAIARQPGLLAQGIGWTIVIWLVGAVSFQVGMAAFGIHTGFVSAAFTQAVVAWGVAIPSAPGFFGTFHFAASFALTNVYGVDAATSLAFAFGYHLGGWLPITLIGLWYAWRLGLSLGEVGASEELVEGIIEEEHARPAARVDPE